MYREPRVVKFVKAELIKGGAKCTAKVELNRAEGRSYFGSAEGACDGPESLRAVAQACANALLQAAAAGGDPSLFEIRVTAVAVQAAFGKETVLVSVSGTYFKQRRDLLGLCIVDGDPVRSAALAVLNATNRFLGVG